MSFLERFQSSLESSCPDREPVRYVVAYSGGVDSHVLLYCCARLKLPLRVIHIHHGLQKEADDWVLHCQNTCDSLGIPLHVIHVDASKKHRQSPEETARTVRYQAIGDDLDEDECLLTAQHQDDQLETFLLQLFRASGSAGLSAMPVSKTVAGRQCLHLRPLLGFSREAIVKFAKENDLVWVEDPSNQQTRYDRNYIRQQILPSLSERWPHLSDRITAVARLQAENLQVLEDMAKVDLAEASYDETSASYNLAYQTVSQLSVTRLRSLSAARLHNILRYWIRVSLSSDDRSSVHSPTRKLLFEIEKALVHAEDDSDPVIAFSRYQFRRYRDTLYLLYPPEDIAGQSELIWDTSQVLEIPALNSRLSVRAGVRHGLDTGLLGKQLRITFRQGGEHFHPTNRQHSQSLKKLFQEAGIPPWERSRVPLLYCGDELVAVVGLWLAKDFIVEEGESGWDITIERH